MLIHNFDMFTITFNYVNPTLCVVLLKNKIGGGDL